MQCTTISTISTILLTQNSIESQSNQYIYKNKKMAKNKGKKSWIMSFVIKPRIEQSKISVKRWLTEYYIEEEEHNMRNKSCKIQLVEVMMSFSPQKKLISVPTALKKQKQSCENTKNIYSL